MSTTADLGTVISGTMRKEDLIPAFVDVLREYAPEHTLVAEYDALPDCDWDELTEEQQEQTDYLLDELFDALNEYAPDFCYFGAHEGDGSDYGFWFSSDSFEDARHCKEVIDVEPSDAEEISRLVAEAGASYACHVNDHGNITLYDCNGAVVLELV